MRPDDEQVQINYSYVDRSGEWFRGSVRGATLADALDLFRRFDGDASALYLIVDEHSMIAWVQHGPKMFEVQLMNHVERRKRFGQVYNDFAEACLRRVFAGDVLLEDLEEHSFWHGAPAWDPSLDRSYWTYRSRGWPTHLDPTPEIE